MMILKVKDTEYKIKFGYNSFCDTDLMDRTEDLIKILRGTGVENDKDVMGMKMIKELFCCVRELLYVGFKKYNPVENVQEVGNLIDEYKEESTEEDKREILNLFTKLAKELMEEGFLGEVLSQITEEPEKTEKVTKIPQDHKKAQKK